MVRVLLAACIFLTLTVAGRAECAERDRLGLEEFFQSADVQYETKEQLAAISDALRQLAWTPAAVREARFPDYVGTSDKWSFVELIDRYFLPSASSFFADDGPVLDAMIASAGCPEGRRAVLERLRTLPVP